MTERRFSVSASVGEPDKCRGTNTRFDDAREVGGRARSVRNGGVFGPVYAVLRRKRSSERKEGDFIVMRTKIDLDDTSTGVSEIYASKMNDGMRQAIDHVVRTRRSIRRFTDRPVCKRLVLEILDIAGRAPSNSNMQPWRVYVVGGAAKDELAQALTDAHQQSPDEYQPERPMFAPNLPAPYSDRRQLLGRMFFDALGIDRADVEARDRQIARNLIFFDAPIAAFFTVDRRMEANSWFDCGLFAQTFMLAAKSRGLDTCAQILLTKYHSVVRRHLPIDDGQTMACGMSIGYADTSAVENTIDIPRVPVGEFASIAGLE
jgi:nitroreductase